MAATGAACGAVPLKARTAGIETPVYGLEEVHHRH